MLEPTQSQHPKNQFYIDQRQLNVLMETGIFLKRSGKSTGKSIIFMDTDKSHFVLLSFHPQLTVVKEILLLQCQITLKDVL